MSPTRPVKATKKPIVEPKRPKANPKTSKRALAVNSGIVIANVLSNVAQFAQIPGIKLAADAASMVFNTIDKVQTNKEDFQIIADDAGELIIAIWRLQENSKNPKHWASLEIRDMVGNLKTALEKVNTIAKRQATRNIVVRVIFNMADAGQIRRTREMINTAVMRFQTLSGIKTIDLLLEVVKKQQELSEDMKTLGTSRVEEEEEEEHPKQTTRSTHAPAFVGPSSAVSVSNGSGNMVNYNVGNYKNNVISNAGNDNSINYYGSS